MVNGEGTCESSSVAVAKAKILEQTKRIERKVIGLEESGARTETDAEP